MALVPKGIGLLGVEVVKTVTIHRMRCITPSGRLERSGIVSEAGYLVRVTKQILQGLTIGTSQLEQETHDVASLARRHGGRQAFGHKRAKPAAFNNAGFRQRQQFA